MKKPWGLLVGRFINYRQTRPHYRNENADHGDIAR